CYDVCPVKIDIPSILVHLRGRVVDERRRHRVPSPEAITMAAAAWTMAKPARWARAQRAARAGRLMDRRRTGRRRTLPPPLAAWTAARDAPTPPPETFR